MSKSIILSMTILLTIFSCKEDRRDEAFQNPIFVFNNALNQKQHPLLTIEEQAEVLAKLGYDGMEYKETDGLLEAVEVFKEHGMKIYANYLKIDIDQKEPYLPSWKEVIPKLGGTDMILWVHIHSEKYKSSDEAADEIIVPIIQELADLAKPYGVKIAIYHHIFFLAEKAEDSFRIAQKVNRENVGSVFNLCHFLRTDDAENLAKIIDLTLPKLFAVSISGADAGDTKNMDWDRLIQPVGEGTFDVYRVVELLADKGFIGPIGIQCWALQSKPEDYLTQTMSAINDFKVKYCKEDNKLSEEEKKEGWKLLFDGESVESWRGINKDQFPENGWKIENGELIANAFDGGESANGGDIITKKKYGKFVLKWEWKMETKGGNSGLKYFVQEGIGENSKYGFGLEYQILDDKNHAWMREGKMQPNDYHTIGSLYEIYPASAEKVPSPLGLWNESMIVCKGNQIEHWLNGKKILEYDRDSEDFKAKIAASKFKNTENFGVLNEGHLLLQDHGSVVHYRNLKIKELK